MQPQVYFEHSKPLLFIFYITEVAILVHLVSEVEKFAIFMRILRYHISKSIKNIGIQRHVASYHRRAKNLQLPQK